MTKDADFKSLNFLLSDCVGIALKRINFCSLFYLSIRDIYTVIYAAFLPFTVACNNPKSKGILRIDFNVIRESRCQCDIINNRRQIKIFYH